MSIIMVNILILILFILLPIGILFLQIHFSKKESPIYGLILPGLSLINTFISLYGIFSVSAPSDQIQISLVYVVALNVFPAVINLIVYYVCRKKRKRKIQFDKMNIQDLN